MKRRKIGQRDQPEDMLVNIQVLLPKVFEYILMLCMKNKKFLYPNYLIDSYSNTGNKPYAFINLGQSNDLLIYIQIMFNISF